MRQLLKTALLGKQHRFLVFLTMVSMIFLTFASQLEVMAMAITARKGPDFFELFAPLEQGKLKAKKTVSRETLDTRWKEMAGETGDFVTEEDTYRFISEHKGQDLLEKVVTVISPILPINKNIKALAFFLLIVALFKSISLFFQRFTSKLVAIRVSRDLRQAFFEHIQSLPMSFYQQHNLGSLSSRAVGDASLIAEALNACLVNYLQTPFIVVSTLSICFAISWKLSLMIFLGFPLIVWPIVFLAKRVKKIARQVQKNQEAFSSVLIDFLAGIQTVKAFAMEGFSLKKYKEQNSRMAALEEKSARYDLSSRPIIHTIGMFFLSAALLYGLYGLQMDVSEVICYCGLLYVFYEPIKKFAEENSHIQKGVAAAERMQEVLSLDPFEHQTEGTLSLEEIKESIVFDNVWFKYGEEWILKGVSFTIKKGEMVALVGPTGSGKSTIAQLLPRFYDVQKGEIRIDGRPLGEYTQKSLREAMAFVSQKPFLFLDTVRANISYGLPYTEEEVKNAACLAQADEFIQHLPLKYDTELLEAGKNLSGGQQQRLAIARAFVKKAPVLILDEATSSLDALSEHKIKQALETMRGRITEVIIAHRLSTIEHADRIVYLEKGEKIAEGTREELMHSCPSFKKMWEMLHSPQDRLREQKNE